MHLATGRTLQPNAAFGNGGRFLQAGIFSTANLARRKFVAMEKAAAWK
jgi:hypothetical protein